jgi:hypothetical protein
VDASFARAAGGG